MIGRTNVSGGGLNINGIIQEYVAGGEILAGDFVTNTDTYTTSIGTEVTINEAYRNVNFAKINDTQYLMVRISSSTLKAAILTIENDSITIGNETNINTDYLSGDFGVPIVKMSENTFFILYAENKLYGRILTINNGSINISAAVQIDTTGGGQISSSYEHYSACKLNNNAVGIVYCGSSTRQLYYTYVSISGTTITVASGASIIDTTQYTGQYCYCEQMYKNILAHIHRGSNNNTTTGAAMGFIKTKDNGGIDYYSNNMINTSSNVYTSTRFKVLDTENCLVQSTNSFNKVIGRDNYSIVNVASYTGKSLANAAVDIVKLNNNTAAYINANKQIDIAKIISGLPISKKAITITTSLNTYAAKGIMISNNKMLCCYGTASSPAGIGMRIITLNAPIISISSENEYINGLAKGSGSTGNNVEIYVPNNSN